MRIKNIEGTKSLLFAYLHFWAFWLFRLFVRAKSFHKTK